MVDFRYLNETDSSHASTNGVNDSHATNGRHATNGVNGKNAYHAKPVQTLGEFLTSKGYSDMFRDGYLVSSQTCIGDR